MILSYIRVNGVRAVADKFIAIPAGIVGAKVAFHFEDPRWDDLTKTAVFRGCVTRDVVMDGDTVIIPHETVERKGGRLYVGVYGMNADGAVAIPTLWAEVGNIRDAADPSGDPSADPSLPVWDQILRASQQAAEESEQAAVESRQAAENAGQNAAKAEDASAEAKEAAEEAARLEAAAKESQQKAAQSESNATQAEERISNVVEEAEGAASAAGAAANAAVDAANSAAGAADSASLSAESAARSTKEAREAAEEALRIVNGADVVKSVNGQTPDENGNVQIEVGTGSGVEVTAKPGQLIRVKSVDETGKPTEWEAVPWGYTEGGLVEILPECQPTYDEIDGFFVINNDFTFVGGETYTVNWNGVEYNCVAQEVTDDGLTVVIIGNVGRLTGGTDTGEPFVIMRVPDDAVAEAGCYAWVIAFDGSTSVTLSISGSGEVIHPIPGKLLPEGVPYVEQGGVIEIIPETTLPLDDDGTAVITTEVPQLVAGETYTVNWNGVEYNCVAQVIPEEAEMPGVSIGNLGPLIGTDTGEPFVIVRPSDDLVATIGFYAMIGGFDGSTSVTLSIMGDGDTIHKLDNRCLDLDWLPTKKVKETEILPKMLTSEYNNELRPTTLPVGTVVAVYWDGVRHECTVSSVVGAENAVYFGYLGGDPFAFIAMYESLPYTINTADGEEHTVSVSLIEYEYNVIPDGYLGESAPKIISLIDLGMGMVYTGTEMTFSADTSEIMGNLENGRKVKVVFKVNLSNGTKSNSGTVTANFDGMRIQTTSTKAFLFSTMVCMVEAIFCITLRIEEGRYVASVHKLLDTSTS